MKNFLWNIFRQIKPFIALGMFIVLLAVGIVFLWYVLIYGAIVGVILYVIRWIQLHLFPHRKKEPRQGRIIEHDNEMK